MIAVLDLGDPAGAAGVAEALWHIGADPAVSSLPDELRSAEAVVITGGKDFAAAMRALRVGRHDRMIERRLAGGLPVLGIGVGMQILFERDAGGAAGLDQWPGVVEEAADVVRWAPIHEAAGSRLFRGLEGEKFFFANASAVLTDPAAELTGELFEPPLVSFAHIDMRFVAAVENGSLTATQFYPEKSADAGSELLRNWLATV